MLLVTSFLSRTIHTRTRGSFSRLNILFLNGVVAIHEKSGRFFNFIQAQHATECRRPVTHHHPAGSATRSIAWRVLSNTINPVFLQQAGIRRQSTQCSQQTQIVFVPLKLGISLHQSKCPPNKQYVDPALHTAKGLPCVTHGKQLTA